MSNEAEYDIYSRKGHPFYIPPQKSGVGMWTVYVKSHMTEGKILLIFDRW